MGASGFTGRLLAACLAERGTGFIAAGRDEGRLRAAVGHIDAVVGIRTVDVRDEATLRHVLGEADVVVSSVGPFAEMGAATFVAAQSESTAYVDVAGEPSFVRWCFDRRDRATAVAVPGCGLNGGIGDLLAHVAGSAVGEPAELHVAYLVRGRGMAGSPAMRRSVAATLDQPPFAYVDGELVREPTGQVRRPAWFPRPVGPRSSAGFHGLEPITVPFHLPSLRLVRTYLAVPGVLADAAGLALAWRPARRVLTRLAGRWRWEVPDRLRAAVRWVCLAEAVSADGRIARGWANGSDVHASTAELAAEVATRLMTGMRTPGVRAASEAVDAGSVLDALAAREVLRWSVQEPVGADER